MTETEDAKRIKKSERDRKWYRDNRERVCERARKWYRDNREKARETQRRWESNNREKRTEQKRRWAKNNPEKVNEKKRNYRRNNPEKHREQKRRWYGDNREKAREYRLRYEKKYPERKLERERRYRKAHPERHRNINAKVKKGIHRCLKKTKGRPKGFRHWEDLVGYTAKDLENNLKHKIPRGYTWQDFIDGKLHLDHKVPITAFNITCAEDINFKECWSLKNLQLLPAKDNLTKGGKIKRPFQPFLPLLIKCCLREGGHTMGTPSQVQDNCPTE